MTINKQPKLCIDEAEVYKRHGVTQLSSSAGHVSDCDLGSGQCELHSQGRIVWNVDVEENWLFMPYRNLSGKLSEKKINICVLPMTYNWFCLIRAI